MQNKCRNIQNILLPYIEGELSNAEKAFVDSHIQQCKQCMEQYQFLKETLSLINIEKDVKPKPFLYTRINARQTSKQRPQLNWATATTWATIVLLIGIVIGTALGRATLPEENSTPSYTTAYLLDDTQMETLEYKLLNEETE
ncbi:MAG: zf-HC2 domain-containing protein [Prolixibacteraceae bacterium]|jgi:predicted anti-sigma-YlaC factor YlaD|nr:zf-HC2 domain-containing protein [Prolixibacteraceae bacterium]